MIEQAKRMNRISKIIPQPQPVQEAPLPNPKRFCIASKIQVRKVNFNKPERHPGSRWYIASSYSKWLTTK
jgi:hypothetical protein